MQLFPELNMHYYIFIHILQSGKHLIPYDIFLKVKTKQLTDEKCVCSIAEDFLLHCAPSFAGVAEQNAPDFIAVASTVYT